MENFFLSSHILEEISRNLYRECGTGADAWRRTGALTFDGNRKVKRKVTFKHIQEYLEGKCNCKISYGTIVQLCIAHNKRRKSATWYKGVASVASKHARKGFNICYNLDTHTGVQLFTEDLRRFSTKMEETLLIWDGMIKPASG